MPCPEIVTEPTTPPTDEQLAAAAGQKLKYLIRHVQEHFNDPRALGRHFAVYGFRVDPDDWGKVQTIRDTLAKLWYPGRSGGVC